MRYFQAVLRESFRLFPTAHLISRVIKADYSLRGFHIPANTMAIVQWDVIHRDPRYFPDYDVFRPERWVNEEEAKKIHPLSVT